MDVKIVTIRPSFDPETRTWFLDESCAYRGEAKTVAELIDKLSSRAKFRTFVVPDYYPVGKSCPPVKYPESTIAEILKRPDPPSSHVVTNRMNPLKRRPPTPIPDIGDEKFTPPVPKPPKPKISHVRPPRTGRLASDLTPAERIVIENQVLDMWAAGHLAKHIAAVLNLRLEFVASNIIPIARSRGDKRAVVRAPHTIGIQKFRV